VARGVDGVFRRLESDGFDLLLDTGGRSEPRTLAIELDRRRRRVRAFWNDLAWVE